MLKNKRARIMGQIRTWVGMIGAALVAGGYVTAGAVSETIDLLMMTVGGALSLFALAMSWWSKDKMIGEGDLP